LQGIGVHTAGKHLAGGRLHGVVGAGQAGDGVEQNDDIALVFDQSLGLFDDHFGDLDVATGGFVKGGGDDFTAHGALHFGDFFRALVNEQDDEHGFRVIGCNRMCDVLHHHGLAGLGRGDKQATRAFADGGDDVDDTAGQVFFGLDVAFQLEGIIGEQRGQVFEQDLVLEAFRGLAVDLVQLGDGEVTFAVLGGADFALDGVAGVQVEATYLRGRDVDVVRAGQVGGFG
jgi:hypothetical protein